MEMLSDVIGKIDAFLWGAPLLILLVFTHLFFTFRLKFIQRYIPLGIRLSITRDPDGKGDISQFGALAIALAATIGTGNIIGVSTAIVMGGPGAVFWCWLLGVFGIATKYAETLLSVRYRFVGKDGIIHGGAMYAIQEGMHNKWLAILFAVFTVLASVGIGCMVQSNAVASFSEEAFSIPVWVTGAVEAILFFAVVIGGINIISKVCGFLVPVMALLYVAGCVLVLAINAHFILPALTLIVKNAFGFKAISGGFCGGALILAMRYGIARGLFSNESGLGSAPIVAASAKTVNPVRQALISSTGTFWDTVCVCALTGLAVVSSILKLDMNADFSAYTAVELPKIAFSAIPVVGNYILAVSLVIFGYTTIIGWFCYGKQAIVYLGGTKSFVIYRIVYLSLIFIGSVLELSVVWDFSDIANGLMAIPNIIALFALNSVICKETEKYLWKGDINAVDHRCREVNDKGVSIKA